MVTFKVGMIRSGTSVEKSLEYLEGGALDGE